MVSTLRISLIALFVGALAGCGFQLRGAYDLPYESIYLAAPEFTLVGSGLKRAIGSSGTRLAKTPQDAQAIFQPTGESRLPIILSLSSAGRVREKRLSYRYSYRMMDNKGRDLILPVTVEIYRDLTYADSDVLAKDQEEQLLWRDMERDLVQQLMRRLAAVKPMPPDEVE